MEATALNIDRLVTVGAGWGGRPDRWIVPALYESAAGKLGGGPVSLAAARKLLERVGEGDRVILVNQFGYLPNMPWGETDGPLGVASLARVVRLGLKGLPVLVSGPADQEVARCVTRAAGLNVLPFERARGIRSAAAGEMLFPVAGEAESRDIAAGILDECSPAVMVSVETVGPNRAGVKHSGAGYDVETEGPLPRVEEPFYEAARRGIPTIGVIDRGNELGSGAIEETVRAVTPYADVCRCPCQEGGACAVGADIVFPASVSNWGAYAITAMAGYLLKQPELLQDGDTEYRMLDAAVRAGAVDGIALRAEMGVDGAGIRVQQSIISLLHAIVENGLRAA